MSFDTLGLRPESLRAIAEQGYTAPTPVQTRAIPAMLAGRDLLVGAQTGTGKTAAFVIPMIERLHASRAHGRVGVRALIVVPTRELALQVEQSVRTYGAHRPVRSTAIFGGMPMGRQVQTLRAGVEVVVATPGRLLDHVRQGTVDLNHVAVLVLDEADRMLDMGFIHDIRRILERLPSERQSLLFSATFSPHLRRLAEDLLRDPLSIDAAPQNSAAAPIRQVAHPVDHGRRRELLSHLLRGPDMGQVLVFTRTKRGADRLSEQLGRDGIRAIAIHGNKNQSQRVRALGAFKRGDAQVLVATDIAARGLDIESLPHVVNFELPVVPEDYVHRIGRTGRAGQLGTAVSLVTAEEQGLMRAIERLLKQTIDLEVIDGFEPNAGVDAVPVAGEMLRRPDTRKVAVPTPRRRRGHQGGHQSVVSGRSDGRVRSHVGAPAGGRWAHAQSRLAPPGRTDGDGSAGHPGRHTRVILPGERLSGREPGHGRRSARRD